MKKISKRRIISLFLSLIMIVSSLPLGAFILHAEGDIDYSKHIGCTARFNLDEFSNFLVHFDPATFDYYGSDGDLDYDDSDGDGSDWDNDAYWLDNGTNNDDPDIPEDHLLMITDYYLDDESTALWYKVEAADGYELPSKMELNQLYWVFQDFTDPELAGGNQLIIDEKPDDPEFTSTICDEKGNAITEITLPQTEKKTVSVKTTADATVYNQWQVFFADRGIWVDVYKEVSNTLNLSYALLKNVTNSGHAYVRCKSFSAGQEVFSEPLTVKIAYDVRIESAPVFTGNANAVVDDIMYGDMQVSANDVAVAALETYTITIHYVDENGDKVFDDHVEVWQAGEYVTHTVTLPFKVGYEAVYGGNVVTKLNMAEHVDSAINEDMELTVVYRPAVVDYVADFFFQNVNDDEYQQNDDLHESIVLSGRTGDITTIEAPQITGFQCLYFDQVEIAADGSTHMEVYYDRLYVLIEFDLGDGGYGCDPVYVRYGSTVVVPTPIRPGFVFEGWEPTATGPNAEGNYTIIVDEDYYHGDDSETYVYKYMAVWTTVLTTYTVVYWRENADDNGYSYWGSVQHQAMSDTKVSGSDDVPTSVSNAIVDGKTVDEKIHFTYNDALTDKEITVEGDGSAVVNVYYDRKVYTLQFNIGNRDFTEPAKSHTHDDGSCVCNYTHIHGSQCVKGALICGKQEHLHTSCDLSCVHEHNEFCCNKAHLHNILCYGPNSTQYSEASNSNEGFSNYISNIPNPQEGYVYRYRYSSFYNTYDYYYFYDGITWYYLGTNYLGLTFSNSTQVKDRVRVSGTQTPLKCDLEEHDHTGGDCNTLACAHVHSDACYTCGNEKHTHTDSCYSWTCVETNHTHSEECCIKPISYVEGTGNNKKYFIKAKYNQTIGDIWPTASNFPNIRFRAWDFDHIDADLVSKRVNMTHDLCYTGGIHEAKLETATSNTQLQLHYMFESFDQTSPANGDDRKRLNGVYYDKSELYYQKVYSSSLSQKEIMGMIPVDTDVEGNIEFLYYKRNRNTLSFYNVNTTIYSFSDLMYEYPIRTLSIGDILVEDYVAPYPSTYEPNAYYFVGWYTTPEGFPGTEVDWAKMTMPDGDLAIYAKWAPKTHTVKVWLDSEMDVQIGTEQKIDHNKPAHSPGKPPSQGEPGDFDPGKYEDYIFSGWFYKDENGNEKAFSFDNMPVKGDMDVYAKWGSRVPVGYEINFVLGQKDGEGYKAKLDANGDMIYVADPITGKKLAGYSITFEAKAGTQLYPAYRGIDGKFYFPHTNSHTIVMDMDEDKNTFTFYYLMEEIPGYRVEYYLDGVLQNADTKEVTDNNKSVVTETYKVYEGYLPDAYQKTLILSLDEDENVIKFYYTKNETSAPYRVNYYVEQLDGTYLLQTYEDFVGTIGENVTVPKLTFNGFDYYGYSEGASVTVIPGEYPSHKLTKDGYLINLYYNLKKYPYAIYYQRIDDKTNLLDPEIFKDPDQLVKYGQTVTAHAKDIPGYTLISSNSISTVIGVDDYANPTKNVITFYYTEQQIRIDYVVVDGVGGTLTMPGENIFVMTGEALGSRPTAALNYEFLGWYMDEACTVKVPSNWVGADNHLNPQADKGASTPYVAATYYAKFGRTTADLVITNNTDKEDVSYIFHVKGNSAANSQVDLYISIEGSDSVLVPNVPVGNYTVTLVDSWSFTSDVIGSFDQTVTLNKGDSKELEFENDYNGTDWLSGENHEDNHLSK